MCHSHLQTAHTCTRARAHTDTDTESARKTDGEEGQAGGLLWEGQGLIVWRREGATAISRAAHTARAGNPGQPKEAQGKKCVCMYVLYIQDTRGTKEHPTHTHLLAEWFRRSHKNPLGVSWPVRCTGEQRLLSARLSVFPARGMS
jgi:hypothetical protein